MYDLNGNDYISKEELLAVLAEEARGRLDPHEREPDGVGPVRRARREHAHLDLGAAVPTAVAARRADLGGEGLAARVPRRQRLGAVGVGVGNRLGQFFSWLLAPPAAIALRVRQACQPCTSCAGSAWPLGDTHRGRNRRHA